GSPTPSPPRVVVTQRTESTAWRSIGRKARQHSETTCSHLQVLPRGDPPCRLECPPGRRSPSARNWPDCAKMPDFPDSNWQNGYPLPAATSARWRTAPPAAEESSQPN